MRDDREDHGKVRRYPELAREFLQGPAAEAARHLFESSGILKFRESFDEAMSMVDGDSVPDADHGGIVKVLLESGTPGVRGWAFNLDEWHNAAMNRRAERAYLVGMAVGLRLRDMKSGGGQ